MSKKLKLPSIFKKKPLCTQPEPISLPACNDDVFTSEGSLFLKPTDDSGGTQSPEIVIAGIRLSERLFFEPEESSAISRSVSITKSCPFKDSVALTMDSDNPYLDFLKSMQETVEIEGIILWKDWDCLEELLGWYLRMNAKTNHGFIIGAFVDLLVGFGRKTMISDDRTTAYYSVSPPSSRQLQ